MRIQDKVKKLRKNKGLAQYYPPEPIGNWKIPAFC
jgi:hypothetical protein